VLTNGNEMDIIKKNGKKTELKKMEGGYDVIRDERTKKRIGLFL